MQSSRTSGLLHEGVLKFVTMPAKRTPSVKSPGRKSASSSKKKRTVKSASSPKLAKEVTLLERSKTVLDPAAMENLYYIAHTAVDAFELRGFGPKTKPKKKRKKGKKKK